MQTDTIRLIAVYGTAIVVVIAGMAMLYLSRGEQNSDFALLIAGFVGAATQFLFGQEASTRSVRSFERGLNTTVVPEGEVTQ